MKNCQKIIEMNAEELAKEFVMPVTYMRGYYVQTTFWARHVGEFDTREEAEEAELKWLTSDVVSE